MAAGSSPCKHSAWGCKEMCVVWKCRWHLRNRSWVVLWPLHTHVHVHRHMYTHKKTHTSTNTHTLIHTHEMCGMSASNPTKSIAVSQPGHSLYQTQSIPFTALCLGSFIYIYTYIHIMKSSHFVITFPSHPSFLSSGTILPNKSAPTALSHFVHDPLVITGVAHMSMNGKLLTWEGATYQCLATE